MERTQQHVNIRVIGKMDMQTGIQFPKRYPTQKEYEDFVLKAHKCAPYCNGSLSGAAKYVTDMFKSLGFNPSLNEQEMYHKYKNEWNRHNSD